MHITLVPINVSAPVFGCRWGEVATREIMDRFYGFLSQTTILCGQIKVAHYLYYGMLVPLLLCTVMGPIS